MSRFINDGKYTLSKHVEFSHNIQLHFTAPWEQGSHIVAVLCGVGNLKISILTCMMRPVLLTL